MYVTAYNDHIHINYYYSSKKSISELVQWTNKIIYIFALFGWFVLQLMRDYLLKLDLHLTHPHLPKKMNK